MSQPDEAIAREQAADVKRSAPDFGPRVALTKNQTPATRAALGVGNIADEYGRTGLRHWGGFVFEEWLRELQSGRRAAEVFREMGDSDPVIGGMLYAIEMLVRRVTWWTEPGSSDRTEKQRADKIDSMRHDMDVAWVDNIAEILGFLRYGWSYHEMVFKLRQGPEGTNPTLRSKYNDGLVGLAKIPVRAQDTLWKWVFDDVGELEGMIQNPPPDYQLRYIPKPKSLLFRTTVTKGNPEGRSVLRSAFRAWYFLKNIQNVEGIGVERDLAGLPVLKAPPGVDIWDQNDTTMSALRLQAQNVVSSIRRDEQEGVILPDGWVLELLSTGGRRQFDTSAIITRYEQRIATSVLLDVILLGQDKVGSYALAGVKKGLFTASLEAYLDQVSAVFNTDCIPTLYALNGWTLPPNTDYPKLCHGTVESVDLETLGTYVQKLAQAGAPLFGADTEDELLGYLLDQAGLPKPGPGAGELVAEQAAARLQQGKRNASAGTTSSHD